MSDFAKAVFWVALGVVLGSGQLKADPVCTANTLAFYETNITASANGCSIGGLNFWHFNGSNAGTNSSGPGSTPFNPSEIELTPVSGPSGNGFMITPLTTNGFEAFATGEEDVELPFLVGCADGTACITDISMSLSGSVTGTTSGGLSPGEDILTETYCLGGTTVPPTAPCANGTGVNQQYLNITLTSGGTDSGADMFSGVSEISMDKDIQAVGNNGSATVSSVEDLFSTSTTTPPPSTPEPGSILLLGMGLTGLAFLSARRRSAAKQRLERP